MPIRIINTSLAVSKPIKLYASSGARSIELSRGEGTSHAYVVLIEPGGSIGPHPAGFDQLFLTTQGSGWIAGSDGVRHTIDSQNGAFVPKGEVHSKGSEVGMIALMVQADHFTLAGVSDA